jgi:ferrous iron transport protein B
MLIIPFMSCSARLPVYVLFISAFFAEHAGSMLFLVYMIGVAIAVFSGMALKKTIFHAEEVPFVMELPPYRMPHIRTTLRHMWDKGVEYLKKIGGVILVASVIIWVLGNYPSDVDYSRDYDGEIAGLSAKYERIVASVSRDRPDVDQSETLRHMKDDVDREIERLSYARESERLSRSYIGMAGRAVAPVMEPLGFDWKMTISIITGLAAKEVVVGTMGVLYHADPAGRGDQTSLVDRLRSVTHAEGPLKGTAVFTPLVAFRFIIFVLIYFPCAAVIATIRRESGSWRWAAFAAIYTTLLAWIVTFMVQQAGKFLAG